MTDLQTVCDELNISPEDAMKFQEAEIAKAKAFRESREQGLSFKELAAQLPCTGTLLRSEDGSSVKVFENWKSVEGKPFRTLYCQAKIDEEATGWYLHSEDFGLKCLIGIEYHGDVGEDDDGLYVNALRVIRETKSGRALICGVELEDEDVQ